MYISIRDICVKIALAFKETRREQENPTRFIRIDFVSTGRCTYMIHNIQRIHEINTNETLSLCHAFGMICIALPLLCAHQLLFRIHRNSSKCAALLRFGIVTSASVTAHISLAGEVSLFFGVLVK
ncbi:hypothetical protein D5086_000800 [Populus alba]|uniref:Uncharacterized protein n=1 Tax=Populus alba TaxID=43335 RepID=A0ACC4CYF5_POPAL